LLTERTGGGCSRSGGAWWGARSNNGLEAAAGARVSLVHGPFLKAAAAARGRSWEGRMAPERGCSERQAEPRRPGLAQRKEL
jgi:hypothetical protein